MLLITDGASLARALTYPLNSKIKRLLLLRADQLGTIESNARFVVVEAGDTPKYLEEALGFSVFQNPADGTCFGDPDFTPGWEWMEDHGFCFELVFIWTDDGFAHVVLVDRTGATNPRLLDLCTAFAPERA